MRPDAADKREPASSVKQQGATRWRGETESGNKHSVHRLLSSMKFVHGASAAGLLLCPLVLLEAAAPFELSFVARLASRSEMFRDRTRTGHVLAAPRRRLCSVAVSESVS